MRVNINSSMYIIYIQTVATNTLGWHAPLAANYTQCIYVHVRFIIFLLSAAAQNSCVYVYIINLNICKKL